MRGVDEVWLSYTFYQAKGSGAVTAAQVSTTRPKL